MNTNMHMYTYSCREIFANISEMSNGRWYAANGAVLFFEQSFPCISGTSNVYICVCMYVCVYVCKYVCLCVYMCISVNCQQPKHIFVCMYVCVRLCMYVNVYVYIHMHVFLKSLLAASRVNLIHACMYMSMYVCKYACM